MKRTLLALALFMAFAANATPGGEHNNTGCNGVGNANSPCAGSGGTGGTGGQGGAGGAGGNAAAIAAAQARADARATAIAAQRQAQRQQQRQTQSQQANNSLTNTINVSVPESTGDTKTAQSQTVKEAGSEKAETVVVAPDVDRRPVNTAYAAPLTSSPETCMGSSSGGVQGASFGVSIASTWESVKCDRRMFARSLESLGKRAAAVAMLCLDDDVRKAMAAAGDACPGADGKRADRAEDILNGRPVASAEVRLLP